MLSLRDKIHSTAEPCPTIEITLFASNYNEATLSYHWYRRSQYITIANLLAKNAEVLVTMDGQRRKLKNAGIYVEDGFIKQIGLTGELPATADVVLDLSGKIPLPGFVNTHHHLNQTLTRNLPAAQNNNLFPWLQAQYRIWARTTEEASRASTLIGLAELALSGCTTVFDHTYVFKNGNNVDCQVQAAKDIGMRFHASRGSMSLGQSQGGLPPDDCVEDSRLSSGIASGSLRPIMTARRER